MDTLLDTVDKPIARIIKKFNEEGFETTSSCCGFDYDKQDSGKHHAAMFYIKFYAFDFDKLSNLREDIELLDEDGLISIEYIGRPSETNAFILSSIYDIEAAKDTIDILEKALDIKN